MSPFVSIGLPVAAEPISYLRDAIRSVLNQSHQNWELIVVADGSPAATVAYLRSFQDPRIRVLAHEASKGLAARLNEIAREAHGDFLARMDADDIMMPERISHQLAALSQSGADLVSGRSVIIDEDNTILAESASLPTAVDVASMFKSTPFIHPTVLARTTWFRDHPYDETLLRCQDKALWITSAVDSRYFRDPEHVLFYRVAGNLNPSKFARSASFERRIVRRYGPRMIGIVPTAVVLARSMLKQTVIRMASMTGRAQAIMRRRYAAISEPETRRWAERLTASVVRTSAEPAPRTEDTSRETS
ncbi:glycosyltransferase family 2 protein [Microbacterium sp. MYb64]|uniref:glycosyltransferase family 2 protein n=1 Tax=Microbacterium sp. MYb64 TaxID=1848691 RepID=UPI0015E42B6D|nr:glycosyltransferase family 2 protein [Microbacterium sp. MYb64]